MARVTDKDLEQVIRIINSNIPDEFDHIGLRGAYGSTGVSTHHDSYDLSGLMSKGEVMNWLRGFQEGMSLGRRLGRDSFILETVKETEALNKN